MRVTRLSGSEGGGILCDSPYPYSDFLRRIRRIFWEIEGTWFS